MWFDWYQLLGVWERAHFAISLSKEKRVQNPSPFLVWEVCDKAKLHLNPNKSRIYFYHPPPPRPDVWEVGEMV